VVTSVLRRAIDDASGWMTGRRARRSWRRVFFAAPVAALAIGGVLLTGAAVGAQTNKQVVVFGFTGSGDNYVSLLHQGMLAEAKTDHLQLKMYQTPLDQTTQNNQVTQQLATGSKPAAYVWIPVDPVAGLASLKKLAATGVPVIQVSTQPDAASLPYVKFYTGTNYEQNGVTSAAAVIAARSALKKAGAKLHSANGNLVIVSWPQSLSVGQNKLAGLNAGLKSNPLTQVDNEYSTTTDATGGFAAMNTAISRVGTSKGIDVVYGMNDGLADGAILALKAAGYQPGKNVMVVGGNCFGDFTPLVDGTQFSTIVVSGKLEGEYDIKTVAQYLANGHKVLRGSYTAPATPGAPNLPASPHQNNFLPQPALIVDRGSQAANQKVIDNARLWGQSDTALCGVA
jgi:ABC-type sugar transport system substrate-binding protein